MSPLSSLEPFLPEIEPFPGQRHLVHVIGKAEARKMPDRPSCTQC